MGIADNDEPTRVCGGYLRLAAAIGKAVAP